MHWQVFFSADNLCGLLAWLFYLSPASWFSLSSPYIASCSSLIWLRNVWGLWQVYEILGLLHVNIVLPEDSLRLHKVQESICCSGKGQTRCSFRNDPFQKHNNFRNKLAIETGRRKSELQWNNVYIRKMDNWKKGRYIFMFSMSLQCLSHQDAFRNQLPWNDSGLWKPSIGTLHRYSLIDNMQLCDMFNLENAPKR